MPTITFRDNHHTYTKHSVEDALILLGVLWDNFSYRLAPARDLLDAWYITPERVEEFLADEDEDEGDKKALRNLADLVRDKLHGNWNAPAVLCTVEIGDYGDYWTPEDMPPREALEKALIGHNLRIEYAPRPTDDPDTVYPCVYDISEVIPLDEDAPWIDGYATLDDEDGTCIWERGDGTGIDQHGYEWTQISREIEDDEFILIGWTLTGNVRHCR